MQNKILLVVDTNIIFSTIYNSKGLERRMLDLSMERDEIKLFAPDVFWEEIKRNLIQKLQYTEDEIDILLSNFDIIRVPDKEYKEFLESAKKIISHDEDAPFIASSLFLNCPIWSGNENHFKELNKTGKVIWFNSKQLIAYLKDRDYFIDET